MQVISSSAFDAFAVTYSITDRVSYQVAVDTLYQLRQTLAIKDTPIILIANKIDLVRKRKVSREGKSFVLFIHVLYHIKMFVSNGYKIFILSIAYRYVDKCHIWFQLRNLYIALRDFWCMTELMNVNIHLR